MENYDPQVAKQVWARVQRRDEAHALPPTLLTVIRNAEEDAAVCRRLHRDRSGRMASELAAIAQKEEDIAACLKGILRLQADTAPAVTVATGARPADAVLQHCLGHTLLAISHCTDLGSHPEYGPVFTSLARQETEIAQRLLGLLGRLTR